MKKRDFLDLFGEIDPDIVDDAAPDKNKVQRAPKTIPYRKIIASVACCALILGGVIATIPIFDDILHPNTHSNGSHNNKTSEIETEIDSRPSLETDFVEMPPYNFDENIVCNINDDNFSGYSFASLECVESIIGDKLGDYSVNFNGIDGELLYVGNAEIFEIKGIDGSVMLCYSFTDAGGYCEENKYWYFPNYEINYNSLADMLSKFSFGENLKIQSKCTYGDNTREHYYTKYDISGAQKDRIAEIFMSVGTPVDEMSFECAESVQITMRGADFDYAIAFTVLDNGYVSVNNFKKYFFEIGVAKAKDIIEIVKSGVPTEGYEWIEEESIWGTIDPNEYAPEIEMVSFHKYLEDLGLMNNLYLDGNARYSAMYSQTDREQINFVVGNVNKQQILDILYTVDGNYYYLENCNDYKHISLKYYLGDGSKAMINIHESGYISIGGGSFYVGEEDVNQIFDIVYKQCQPPRGYCWNEKDQRWYKSTGTETESEAESEAESETELTAPSELTIPDDGIKIYSRYESDSSYDDRFFSVTIPSLNNATLEYRTDYEVYLDGERLQDFAATSCDSFFLSDLTGDGYPELCLNVSFGFGMIDQRIVIVDLKTKKTIFTKENRSINDYYLCLTDGILQVVETKCLSFDVTRTGVLAYNGSEVTIIWDSEINENAD